MKRNFLIAILVVATSSLGFVQKPHDGMPKKVLKADLVCSITASLDEAGTQPIVNGGHVTNHFEAWFHWTVTNNGPGTAQNFKVKRSIVDGTGNKLYDPAIDGPLTLGSGEKHVFASHRIALGPAKVSGDITVDTEQTVTEKTRNNNHCLLTFMTLHVPPHP